MARQTHVCYVCVVYEWIVLHIDFICCHFIDGCFNSWRSFKGKQGCGKCIHTHARTVREREGKRHLCKHEAYCDFFSGTSVFPNLNYCEIVFNSHNRNINLHICFYIYYTYVLVRYVKIRTSFHPPIINIVLRNITTYFFASLFSAFSSAAVIFCCQTFAHT